MGIYLYGNGYICMGIYLYGNICLGIAPNLSQKNGEVVDPIS